MKRMGTFLVIAGFALMAACGKAPTGAGGSGGGGAPADQVGAAAVAGPEFGYPVAGEPWYFIRYPFVPQDVPAGLEAAVWTVSRVEVNGARARDFIIYQNGREADKNGIRAEGGKVPLDIKVRHNWKPQAEARVSVELAEAKSGKKMFVVGSAKAPPGKGYWDPAWKNYLSLVLSEEHGFARQAYPVHATVGVLTNYLGSPDEVRVVRAEKAGADVVYEEVPSQVYDVVTWNDPKVLAVEE